MDHNDFNFDDDFIDPIVEFFKQINLDTEFVAYGYTGISFSDDYYFPPPNIVAHEKRLIKSSIIWDIIEDRKRQADLKKMQVMVDKQKAESTKNGPQSTENLMKIQKSKTDLNTEKEDPEEDEVDLQNK